MKTLLLLLVTAISFAQTDMNVSKDFNEGREYKKEYTFIDQFYPDGRIKLNTFNVPCSVTFNYNNKTDRILYRTNGAMRDLRVTSVDVVTYFFDRQTKRYSFCYTYECVTMEGGRAVVQFFSKEGQINIYIMQDPIILLVLHTNPTVLVR